jgi:hypothetical protein
MANLAAHQAQVDPAGVGDSPNRSQPLVKVAYE